MAKQITGTWQEAMKMVSNCKIMSTPNVNGPVIEIVLQDPMGQVFAIRFVAGPVPQMNGNILTIGAQQDIVAVELEKGDRVGDFTFDG